MIVRDYDHDDIDDDDWDEDDGDGDDGVTDPCPGCGELIYDEAERCPFCGRYLSREDTREPKPWWVVLGVLMCLGVVIWWILHP